MAGGRPAIDDAQWKDVESLIAVKTQENGKSSDLQPKAQEFAPSDRLNTDKPVESYFLFSPLCRLQADFLVRGVCSRFARGIQMTLAAKCLRRR